MLGCPEWTAEERFADPTLRADSITRVLLPRLRMWASTRTKTVVADLCRAAGLAAAPINGPADIENDPHFLASRMIDTVKRADGSLLKVAGNPIKLSESEAQRPADVDPAVIARPGEHTSRCCPGNSACRVRNSTPCSPTVSSPADPAGSRQLIGHLRHSRPEKPRAARNPRRWNPEGGIGPRARS